MQQIFTTRIFWVNSIILLLLLVFSACDSNRVALSETSTNTVTLVPSSSSTPTLQPTFTPKPTLTVTPNGGGEHVAFVAVEDTREGKVYIAKSDGSNVTPISTIPTLLLWEWPVGHLSWSPDGSKIAFAERTLALW